MAAGLRGCAGGADRFVVIDTETTGVYRSDRVVEIALVTLSLDGDVIDVFDTLLQPGREVSATHIHGITASMVARAPTFADVAGDVAVRLDGACLVAHNLPFDYRMVGDEFERLGVGLSMTAGVDTLWATGCRLIEACSMFAVPLDGAHRALSDAMATSQLLAHVAESCKPGSPAYAPRELARTGRVLRRDDTVAIRLPDPPLITYLASRLALSGVEAAMLSYLEVVGRAVADLHLDKEERAELMTLAGQLGLTPAQIAQAHRRFANELIDAAVADAEVTDAEHDMLVRIAAALDVDQLAVESRLRPFRSAVDEIELADGMSVVFTGDHPVHDRETLRQVAEERGFVVQSGVSKSTKLVVAVDTASNSGKAAKARQYGIPVVSVDDFISRGVGDVIVAHGAGQTGLKVITCPDCLATWTVAATVGAARSKRCDDCAPITTPTGARPKVQRDMWAPPSIEWLTCESCGCRWHRETARGRKPRQCPTCVGVSGVMSAAAPASPWPEPRP